MQSKASTVPEYLSQLPENRRSDIEKVREVILANLDPDFEEGMLYGMIGYFVPHSLFPQGYHCDPRQPLSFAALASQKNYMSLYLMAQYGNSTELDWFLKEWAKTGKKLDMGKSCIRFKSAEDLALDVIGKSIKRIRAKKYIATYESFLAERDQATQAKKASPEKSTKTTKKTVVSKKSKDHDTEMAKSKISGKAKGKASRKTPKKKSPRQ